MSIVINIQNTTIFEPVILTGFYTSLLIIQLYDEVICYLILQLYDEVICYLILQLYDEVIC